MRRSAEAIQDELVTIRNDRFVIPVKADHRAAFRVSRMVTPHPAPRLLLSRWKRSRQTTNCRVCMRAKRAKSHEFSSACRRNCERNCRLSRWPPQAVTELDFINATRDLSSEFQLRDSVNSARSELRAANGTCRSSSSLARRKPAGFRRSCGVPVSFALDNEKNAMVISGANAGGKTVVLKTTGLLSLMALSGLSVPAKSARFPFYAISAGRHRRSPISGRKSFDVYFTCGEHRSDDRNMRSAGAGPAR